MPPILTPSTSDTLMHGSVPLAIRVTIPIPRIVVFPLLTIIEPDKM